DAMKLENIFCQVDTQSRYLHLDAPSAEFTLVFWHLDAVNVGASISLSVADCPWQRCLARQPKMRAKRQHPNLSPPGNLTTDFDTIKDDSLGEWSTGIEAIEGAERRNGA
ncbi:hypothetical protein, partial [Gibbsiella quercinecans]|uniref:hypothetical protein n=1 Tax=Gibbsiella quercinecans TaxID=929813 RepID=UPI001E5B5A52